MRSKGILALLLLGCLLISRSQAEKEGATNKPQKEIAFLTMQLHPTFQDYINNLINKYQAQHPDIKIKWLDYPAENYDTKLLTDFRGHNPPDIINLTYEWGLRFYQLGVLHNLNGYVASEVLDSYFPEILRTSCSYQGKVYALPWYLATHVTMYNKELVLQAGLDPSKPPRNYEELAQYSKIIKEKTGIFGFMIPLTEAGTLKGLLVQDGVKLIDESGQRAVFNTPQGVATLSFWADVFKQGLIPRESLTGKHRRAIELYKTGKTAFFVSGPQFLKLIKHDAPDVYENTLIAPKVLGKSGEIDVDVMNLVIAKETKYPQESADFAAFVTNGQNQLEFCKIVTILPSVIAAAQSPYFTQVEATPEGQARKIGAQQLFKAKVLMPPLSHIGKLNQAMDEAIQKACLGIATPKEALDEAKKKWDQILAR